MSSATSVRFIKVIATGEVNNNNVTCIAGRDIVTPSGMILDSKEPEVPEPVAPLYPL